MYTGIGALITFKARFRPEFRWDSGALAIQIRTIPNKYAPMAQCRVLGRTLLAIRQALPPSRDLCLQMYTGGFIM